MSYFLYIQVTLALLASVATAIWAKHKVKHLWAVVLACFVINFFMPIIGWIYPALFAFKEAPSKETTA